jgi:hypothetical protein
MGSTHFTETWQQKHKNVVPSNKIMVVDPTALSTRRGGGGGVN